MWVWVEQGTLPPQGLQLGSETHDGTAWSEGSKEVCVTLSLGVFGAFCASWWEILKDNTTESHVDHKTRKKHQCLPPHAQQIQVPHALPLPRLLAYKDFETYCGQKL